jgi:hypothetical protein
MLVPHKLHLPVPPDGRPMLVPLMLEPLASLKVSL